MHHHPIYRELMEEVRRLYIEELARILPLICACVYTHIAFISPKGMGLKIIVHTCHPDGTLPLTIQEINDSFKKQNFK